MDEYVRIIPLGGLNTFGMNCCLIEHAGKLLMIDCGIAFPDANDFGLDYYLPDWTYALENRDRLLGVIVTHAHEDHIGAMPFLLEQADIPVFTGRYSLEALRSKLREWGIEPKAKHMAVDAGDVVEVGPFELEFIHVNHSAPNAFAVSIRTSLGEVVFTGDWRVDHTPIGEPVTDLAALARLGDEGVLALVADSTNAQVPGSTRSERDVQAVLERIIRDAPGRVIIAMFSSNVPRIRGLTEIAQRSGRRIALLGRSLNKNVGIARETGFLDIAADDPFVDAARLDPQDNRAIVLATGSQAEPRSALARLAQGDHNLLNLAPDDTVVLSARMIPGNEAHIQRMIDALVRRGATVITPLDAPVHTSGHAYREEMKLLINLVRPEWVVPVHGEFRMRLAHSALAEQLGMRTMLIEDGDVLEIREDAAMITERIAIGRIAVDGTMLGELDDVQLRDRRKLAATGIVVAFAVLDRSTGALSALELLHRGFLPDEHNDTAELLERAMKYARDAVAELSESARADVSEVAEALRTSVRRFFRRELERKPVVIPVVHEL